MADCVAAAVAKTCHEPEFAGLHSCCSQIAQALYHGCVSEKHLSFCSGFLSGGGSRDSCVFPGLCDDGDVALAYTCERISRCGLAYIGNPTTQVICFEHNNEVVATVWQHTRVMVVPLFVCLRFLLLFSHVVSHQGHV